MTGNGRIGAALKASVWLVIFLLLTVSMVGGILRANMVLPDAMVYYNPDGPLLFDEVVRALPKVKQIQVNALSSEILSVESSWNGTYYGQVRAVRTDEHYPEFHHLELVRGSFFHTTDTPAENVAIISNRLANQLFLTVNAVGLQLKLGGNICTVVGVYQTDDSLLAQYASDGYDVVYIPYYLHQGSNTVQQLFLRSVPEETDKDYPDKEPAEEVEGLQYRQLMEWDNATKGRMRIYYQSFDFYSVQKLLYQSIRMLVFLCGVVLLVTGLRYLFRFANQLWEFAAETKRQHAIVSIGEWLRAATPALITLGCLLAVLFLTVFEPFYPVGFLPANGHLFDLSHYVNIVTGASHRRILDSGYFYYDNYAYTLLWVNAGYLAACAVSFGLCVSAVQRVLDERA